MNERPNAKEIFQKPPRIETPRLILRAMSVKDSADMFEYAQNEETVRYLLWQAHETKAYTKAYLNYITGRYGDGGFFDWALEEKASGKMIGTAGFTVIDEKNFSAQIGYVLNPAYWGRGYATEAARELISFGFCALGLNRIEALYMTGNEKSAHVMEKCGMTFEGVSREMMFVKGRFRDIGRYALLAADYFALHEKKEYVLETHRNGLWHFAQRK